MTGSLPASGGPASNYAENLIGAELKDGWVVTRKLPKPGSVGAETLTGSFFSIGYIATKGGKEAFLKVIDIASAFKANLHLPVMDRLKIVTDSHTFECSILEVCKKAKLDRVVRILLQGDLDPPEGGGYPDTLYFI